MMGHITTTAPAPAPASANTPDHTKQCSSGNSSCGSSESSEKQYVLNYAQRVGLLFTFVQFLQNWDPESLLQVRVYVSLGSCLMVYGLFFSASL